MIRLTDTQGTLILEMMRAFTKTDIPDVGQIGPIFNEAIEALSAQLNAKRDDQDLLDLIAGVVIEGKAAIQHSTLQQLRTLLLTPSEKARAAVLDKEWQQCAHCGKKIFHGELAVMSDQTPYCYRCVGASYIPCAVCGGSKEIPSKAAKALLAASKEGCGEGCEKPKEPEQVIRTKPLPTRPTFRPMNTTTPTTANWGVVGAGGAGVWLDTPADWLPEPTAILNPAPLPERDPLDDDAFADNYEDEE